MAITLKNYLVRSASIKLTATGENKTFKLQPKMSCSVRKKGDDTVFALFVVELTKDVEQVPFELHVEAAATFLAEGEPDVREMTKKIADATFPFVRQTVAALTQLAGIPVYYLPFVEVSKVLSEGDGKPTPLDINLN